MAVYNLPIRPKQKMLPLYSAILFDNPPCKMDKALAGPIYANYLLHKMAIEDACRAGCHHYHMGESGASDSLAEFKSHFGAVKHPYAEYRIERFPITRIDTRLRQIVKRVDRLQGCLTP